MKNSDWGWLVLLILVPIWPAIGWYLTTVIPERVQSWVQRAFLWAWVCGMAVMMVVFAYVVPTLWIRVALASAALVMLLFSKRIVNWMFHGVGPRAEKE